MYFAGAMLVTPERHQHHVSMKSAIIFPNNARMKNCTDLNLSEAVCLSIICHILDS